MKEIIKLNNIYKSYKIKDKEIKVLNGINVNFNKFTLYGIMGHSGSEKSTLINILGLIEKIDEGNYILYDKEVNDYTDNNLSKLRMKNIGFIFQDFLLKPNLKAYENVMLPMLINKEIKPSERKEKAKELLKLVGLENRVEHFPKELSGGEQERVAIARALANNPDIILADEPTGNLDFKTEQGIFELLKELSKKGKCVIVVSHSQYIKNYADVIYELDSGKLTSVEK